MWLCLEMLGRPQILIGVYRYTPFFLTYVFLVQDSIGTLKKTRSLTSRTNHIAGNQVTRNLVALPTYQVGYIRGFVGAIQAGSS